MTFLLISILLEFEKSNEVVKINLIKPLSIVQSFELQFRLGRSYQAWTCTNEISAKKAFKSFLFGIR